MYIDVHIYILYILERMPGGQCLRMPTSYATYACLIRYVCLPHTRRMPVCLPHSLRMLYILSACYTAEDTRGTVSTSAYLIRYVCLPHTLRMPASYATYACLIRYVCLPHTLRMPYIRNACYTAEDTRGTVSTSAYLIRYVCLPHTLRMPASYATYACLIRYVCHTF